MGEAGLMDSLSGKCWRIGRVWGSSGVSLGGDFDLDFHLGLQQAGDDQQCCCRANVAEKLPASHEMRIRIFDIGVAYGRGAKTGQGEPGFLQDALDGLEELT